MALGEIGPFHPAETTYQDPNGYGNALRLRATQSAAYLTAMDSFYEQLDETIREFNATLVFKETELAQVKGLTEEQIGLSKRQLDISEEQYKSDLALRQQALKEQTAYQTGMLAVENKKVNAAAGTNYLGSQAASDKAFDFLKTAQKANLDAAAASQAAMMKYLIGGSTRNATSSPTYTGTTTPQSKEVNYALASNPAYDPRYDFNYSTGKYASDEPTYGNIDESIWV